MKPELRLCWDWIEIMAANICIDCMKGHHEISGHDDCECSCHNNPLCIFCGRAMKNDTEQLHIECIEPYNDSVAFGSYPWEKNL